MREQLRAALCSYRHCLQNRDESSLSRAAKELRRYMLQFDPYYPSYHYCGPEGRVGDPNGVCKVGDIYHLFCQHRPVLGEKLAPTCWGHAYSSDLIHWVDAPIALYPDTPYDQNGCYSGNIIADGQGGHVAMYTGNIDEHAECYGMMARSTDGLQTWKKQMVLHPAQKPNEQSPVNWDNCLWQSDGIWFLLSGGCENGHGAAFLWTSTDFVNWQLLHNIAPNLPWGEYWELPYLFELNGTAVLLVGHGTACFLGTYDHKQMIFTAESGPFHLDCGHYYSFNAHLQDDAAHGNRRLLHGWVTGIPTPTKDVPYWQGLHSIPRVFRLKDSIPWLEPVQEIYALKGQEVEWDLKTKAETPDAFVVSLTFDGDAELMLFENSSHTEGIRIRISRREKSISIDGPTIEQNHKAYAQPGWDQLCDVLCVRQPIYADMGGDLRVEIFADRSVIEVYCAGAVCTARCFPAAEARGIRLLSDWRHVRSLCLNEMKGIWD